MEENKILFVDLDGTLIKEDLSNLAFFHSLKNYPFKTLFYLFIFLFKGKTYLKEKISKNFNIPFANLTFNKAALDFIKEVRGKGLWIGVEFNKTKSAKKICLSLMDEGILAKETHETVIRFAPPLTITKEEIDWAMEKIIKVFREYK